MYAGGKEDKFTQSSQFLVLQWELQHQALCTDSSLAPGSSYCSLVWLSRWQVDMEENVAGL